MSKTLIIAEKPSVAGDLSRVLGRFQKNKDVYENDDYVISSAVGHLVELSMPEDLDPSWKSWKMANLPILPKQFGLKPIDKTKQKFDDLKKLIKRKDVETIVNACDAGREGELIFDYIYQLTKSKKPVKRLWMQSMTANAIRTAFDSLKDHEELTPLRDAARCRSESDWLIGINGTRAITNKMFAGRMGQVASVGRVQTPTLTLVVERENQIRNFQPRDYWRITASFDIHEGSYEGTYQKPNFKKSEKDDEDRIDRIWEEAEAKRIVSELEKGDLGAVEENCKRSKQQAPRLFNLTSLQREANNRFGFPAGMTLRTTQSLYEKHKVVTYPRTDSKALPEDYGPECESILSNLTGNYQSLGSKVLKNKWVNPENRSIFNNKQVGDHFALIPTNQAPKTLSSDEQKIYDLIVKRFLAVFFPAAEFDITTRYTTLKTHKFKTEGKVLAFAGWLEVYGREEQAGGSLPALSTEDGAPPKAKLQETTLKEETTKPPPRYSDATLLAIMEGAGKLVEDDALAEAMKGKGLGTPATRAQIIDHLIREKYLLRDGKEIAPTPKADQLIAYLQAMNVAGLTSPAMTGEWEYQLHQIEQGKLTRDAFMKEICKFTEEVVSHSKSFDESKQGLKESKIISPTDQKPMVETLSSYRSQCGALTIYKVMGQRLLSEEEIQTLLKEKQIGPLDGFVSRMGKPFSALLKLDEDNKVKFVFGDTKREDGDEAKSIDLSEFPEVGSCPKDGAKIHETPTAYVCHNTPECNFKVGRTILSRTIPREQFLKLIETKKTDLLDKFRSNRTKRLFSAHLVLKDDFSIGFEFAPKEPKAKKAAAKK